MIGWREVRIVRLTNILLFGNIKYGEMRFYLIEVINILIIWFIKGDFCIICRCYFIGNGFNLLYF